jgi:hypothetical protein
MAPAAQHIQVPVDLATPGRADLAIQDQATVRGAHLFANEELVLILPTPHEDFGCE